MTIDCAHCGTQVPAEDSYFSSDGEICSTCHAADAAYDQRAYAAGVSNNPFVGMTRPRRRGVGSSLSLGGAGIQIDITPLVAWLIRTVRAIFMPKAA